MAPSENENLTIGAFKQKSTKLHVSCKSSGEGTSVKSRLPVAKLGLKEARPQNPVSRKLSEEPHIEAYKAG